MIEMSSSKLKARLGKYLRAVRSGSEIVVTDREQPIARIVPFAPRLESPDALVITPADPDAPPFGKAFAKIRGIRYRGTNSTAMLREERDRR